MFTGEKSLVVGSQRIQSSIRWSYHEAEPERVNRVASHGERQPGFVLDAGFVLQVGIPARQEVEVVQRREAEVARHGGFRHDVTALRAGSRRRGPEPWPISCRRLFAQDGRQAEPLRGPPFGRHGGVDLDAPLVVAHDRLVALLQDDVLVGAPDEVLVQRDVGREEPLVSHGVFSRRLPVEGVDPASGAGHGGHDAVARVAAVVVGHPCMDVSGLRADLPVAAQAVPREDAAERVLPLAVLEPGVVGVVGRQQRQFAVRVDIPGVQSEAVAAAGVVIDLLQHVRRRTRRSCSAPPDSTTRRCSSPRRRCSPSCRGCGICSRSARTGKRLGSIPASARRPT